MMIRETEKKKIQINIDRDLADEVQAIFDEIGINQTSALTAFYKKVVAEGGMPFDLKMTAEQKANKELAQAVSTLPVEDLTGKKKLRGWLADEQQDY